MSGCQKSSPSNHSGTDPERVFKVFIIKLRYNNSTWHSSIEMCCFCYLQCPEVETDVWHRVTPDWLWDIMWKPKVAWDQHEYALKFKKIEKQKSVNQVWMDDQDQRFYRMNPFVLNFHMILLWKHCVQLSSQALYMWRFRHHVWFHILDVVFSNMIG